MPDVTVEENHATESILDPGVMSAAYEPAVEPPVAEAAPVEKPTVSPYVSEDIPTIETLLSAESKEILQEEAAHAVTEELPFEPTVEQEVASAYAAPVLSEPAATPPAPDMDEIVAKVLAKMNPEVLQTVTREILKPLVEAMIKDELTKK
jgi:hypothetical protein